MATYNLIDIVKTAQEAGLSFTDINALENHREREERQRERKLKKLEFETEEVRKRQDE